MKNFFAKQGFSSNLACLNKSKMMGRTPSNLKTFNEISINKIKQSFNWQIKQ